MKITISVLLVGISIAVLLNLIPKTHDLKYSKKMQVSNSVLQLDNVRISNYGGTNYLMININSLQEDAAAINLRCLQPIISLDYDKSVRRSDNKMSNYTFTFTNDSDSVDIFWKLYPDDSIGFKEVINLVEERGVDFTYNENCDASW